MSLKEQVHKDLVGARNDELTRSVLRMLNAAIIEKEKSRDKDTPLSDEEVQDVVASEIKKRKESMEQFQEGGREDLYEQEKKELEVLEQYLPEQLSEEEIRKKAQEAIEKVGAEGPSDMGNVMGELMPQVKGKADGKVVNQIVQKLLS